MYKAIERLTNFLWGGTALYVIGVIVAVLAWPHTVTELDGIHSGGNLFFALLGLLAASVGSALLLVALIGYGVKYGHEASERVSA